MHIKRVLKLSIFIISFSVLSSVTTSGIYIILYSLIMRISGGQHELKYYVVLFLCMITQAAIILIIDTTALQTRFNIHDRFKDYFVIAIVFVWVFLPISGLIAKLSVEFTRRVFWAGEDFNFEMAGSILIFIWPLFYFIPIVFPIIIDRVLNSEAK